MLGATPRWEDIFGGLDAPREITNALVEHIESVIESLQEPEVIAVLGAAGAGKSTIVRRLGVRLSQAGRLALLTNSEEVPSNETVRRFFGAFGTTSRLDLRQR